MAKKQPQTKAAPPAPVVAAAPPVTEKPNSGRGGAGRGRGGRGGKGGRLSEKNGKPIKHDGYDRHSGTGR